MSRVFAQMLQESSLPLHSCGADGQRGASRARSAALLRERQQGRRRARGLQGDRCSLGQRGNRPTRRPRGCPSAPERNERAPARVGRGSGREGIGYSGGGRTPERTGCGDGRSRIITQPATRRRFGGCPRRNSANRQARSMMADKVAGSCISSSPCPSLTSRSSYDGHRYRIGVQRDNC